jgi:Rps23 Pro-64 3,4-dihydroxylase Tpa1-like proline 4-hydroxylase
VEKLKKELQEKGYTFFKMQDYPEFTDDYNELKQYICNSEKNLLEYINSVRINGQTTENTIDNRISKDETCNSFEEIKNKVNREYIPTFDFEESAQYWYYGSLTEITDEFKKILSKIVEKLYNEPADNLNHMINLTYYKKDCFLRQHRDGKTGTRICAVLIYLNDEDYKTEWGGNIVFEGTETVDPIYGNVAVLDFKEGNCLHEVKKVVDGYGRYAILDFVSLGKSVDTPNYY